jgi:hypothetical protein
MKNYPNEEQGIYSQESSQKVVFPIKAIRLLFDEG